MSYSVESNLQSSEKITLCQVEPSQQLVLWTPEGSSRYSRSVSYYVVGLKEDDTDLTEVSSNSLSSGEWFFDSENKKLWIRTTDDSTPQGKTISVTYRLFFSDAPINLTHDLTLTGDFVEYLPYLKSSGSYNQKLDQEATGIALESSSSVSFENRDGFFDDIYDKLFFENKDIRIYSIFRTSQIDDYKQLFDGVIETKRFNASSISFSVKDNVFRLRDPIPLPLYSISDNVPNDFIGTPKRLIYGQVQSLKCVPTDPVLDGYSLTGVISGSASGTTLTGSGSSFLAELSPEDEVIIPLEFEDLQLKVESIESDTSATLSEELDSSFSSSDVKVKPKINYRGKNRTWDISSHKLRSPSVSISSGLSPNRFTVASESDLDDFFENDSVLVDGEMAVIKRISSTQVTLQTNLQGGTPSSTLTKIPVSRVTFTGEFTKSQNLTYSRDWNLTNTSSGSSITLTNTAEFNYTRPVLLGAATSPSITFTNGSRTVTGSGIDFKAETLRPRDWIKVGASDDPSHQVWYEILQIDSSTQLQLRVAYAGGNVTATATEKKNIEYIGDDALILIDSLGKENSSGEWVKTASDAVKDILTDLGLASRINSSSFDQTKTDADMIVSISFPQEIKRQSPKARDAITLINESVFGSLFTDENFDWYYQILSPSKPSSITEITDFDVTGSNSFRVNTKGDILKRVLGKYRHFDADRFTGDSGSLVIDHTSTFADRLIDAREEKEINVYLHDQEDAETITQRYAFFHSLTTSEITIRTDLRYSDLLLGDKVYLNFRRLYKRFGQNSRLKACVITGIKRTSSSIMLTLNDLGNIFNRVGAVTADTQGTYINSSETEKLLSGYVVDNTTQLPDNTEEALGSNLIG